MTDQSTTSVFESEQVKAPEQEAKQQETPATKTSQEDVFADRLASIRNEEGKPKYDSIEKALDALNHSQNYIPQLKSELQQREEEITNLRTELEKRGSVEDVVSRLTAKQEQDSQQQRDIPSQSAGLDEQAAKDLFEQMLNENRQRESFASNQRQVQDSLVKTYGEKAAEVVAEKAKELGTSAEELGKLASQNPKMVMALFNSGSGGSNNPSTSSRNIPSYLRQEEQPLERPKKSLLAGASGKDQADFMRQIKESVYKRYGVEQK